MPIALRDRLSVSFHQFINGNVPTKTALRISNAMMNMDKVENDGAVRALQNKVNTSRTHYLPQVASALYRVLAKQAESKLTGAIAEHEKLLKLTEEKVNSYPERAHEIALHIEKFFKNTKVKNEMTRAVYEHNCMQMDDAHKLTVELNDLQFTLSKNLAELKIVEEYLEGLHMADGTKHDKKRVAHVHRRDYLGKVIEDIENKIPKVRVKRDIARNIKTESIINVAIKNERQLPVQCRKLVAEYQELKAVYNASPIAIPQMQTKIEQMQKQKFLNENFSRRVDKLDSELQKATDSEHAKRIIRKFHFIHLNKIELNQAINRAILFSPA